MKCYLQGEKWGWQFSGMYVLKVNSTSPPTFWQSSQSEEHLGTKLQASGLFSVVNEKLDQLPMQFHSSVLGTSHIQTNLLPPAGGCLNFTENTILEVRKHTNSFWFWPLLLCDPVPIIISSMDLSFATLQSMQLGPMTYNDIIFWYTTSLSMRVYGFQE